MREICREMVHVRLQGDSADKRVLFTQGAEATRYYMVVRGAIAIYVRDREHQERVIAEVRRRESEGVYDTYAALPENLGKHIRTLGPGQGVGRQALGEAESEGAWRGERGAFLATHFSLQTRRSPPGACGRRRWWRRPSASTWT